MKTLLKQTAFLFLFSVAYTSVNANTLVNFKNSDLSQIQNQGKKILVSFTAEWCTPCKIMDEGIFSDNEIATLINDNFIAIKADVDSEVGNEWNELYNANYLPTTLFTLENGNEIERLNGTPSRDDFLNFLKKILATDTNTPKASFAKSVESKPVAVKAIESEPAVTKAIVSEEVVNETTPAEPVLPVQSFSIQVGAFYSTKSALKLIDQLNQKGISNSSILEETTNGKLYQKVILTGFDTKSEALTELKSLKQRGIDGFVKKV